MRKILFFIVPVFLAYSAKTQVNQISVGASNVTSIFNAVKYDPSDGGTINVGYVNDPASATGTDCFVVKLNGSQQIVWQKVISNSGDDFLNHVIICANGDYIATGKITVGGIPRGLACRINKSNGNIIWSSSSANSSIGEIFLDVVETSSGNIALCGWDSNSPSITNFFVVLLNSGGSTIWSEISSFPNSDGAMSINQLPNGNLIVAGTNWVGFYNAIIMELNELTGAIIVENAYQINISAPNSALLLNSIWPASNGIKIKNGVVTFNMSAFQGATSPATMCIYTYDQGTKGLSGNIYYHTGDINAVDYVYTQLANNDFLMAQSFTSPNRVYVSRVTNGSIVYDDLINSAVISIAGLDTTGLNAVYCGNATYNTFTNTYNLFSSRNNPATASLCSITGSNTMALQASTLNATATTAISLTPATALNTLSLTDQTSVYSLSTLCGTILPVTLINFSAFYNIPNNTTLLKWSTASEFNNKSFVIERSVDNGVSFLPLGSVPSHVSSGSTGNYNFIDYNPAKGKDLYRLKEIDADNKLQYSKIVSVTININRSNKYYLTPNPANNFTLINSTASDNSTANVSLYDASGKLVKKEVVKIDNGHPYKLSINNIPGIYYVKIQSENSTETLKLEIE